MYSINCMNSQFILESDFVREHSSFFVVVEKGLIDSDTHGHALSAEKDSRSGCSNEIGISIGLKMRREI